MARARRISASASARKWRRWRRPSWQSPQINCFSQRRTGTDMGWQSSRNPELRGNGIQQQKKMGRRSSHGRLFGPSPNPREASASPQTTRTGPTLKSGFRRSAKHCGACLVSPTTLCRTSRRLSRASSSVTAPSSTSFVAPPTSPSRRDEISSWLH